MKHQTVVSLRYCAKWKLGGFQGTVTPCCPIELHQPEVTSGVIWLWIRVSTYHLSYWSLRDRSDKLITLGSNTIATCDLAESVFLYKHPQQQNFGVHARQKVDCKGENTVQQLQSEYITDILMAGLQTCEQAPWPQIRQTFHLAEEARRNLSKEIALACTPQLMLFRESAERNLSCALNTLPLSCKSAIAITIILFKLLLSASLVTFNIPRIK